jgi:hypothetical protein
MSLAAYIVLRDGADGGSVSDLRQWLSSVLPDYMVPSAFVTMEALPLTPNGKVDRQALPDPGRARLTDAAEFVPPRGPIEAAVAEICTELTGGRQFGAHDNFFECGGHSLMAIQLLARVRRIFEVEVPLEDFVNRPTISRLASVIAGSLAEGRASQASPLVRVSRGGPLPASFAQQRLWFLDQLEPGRASYHIPAAVRLRGGLDIEALERALNAVVDRHEALRTTLVSEGGIPRQVIAARLAVPLPVEDLSGLAPDERERQMWSRLHQEAERPFDLARGPLIRAALLRLSDQEHIAAVTMHHAISDGWSIAILIRELSALYGSFRLGEPSPLPEPVIQYADYAAWQRNLGENAGFDSQLAYWKGQLAGVPHLELPTDRPRPPVASQRGGLRSTTLPIATRETARALGRSEGATLYMTLLAVFQIVLHRYSGQEDIAVGSPIAGRVLPEFEALIGFFVNTLVLRGDLSGDPPLRELLRRVRRTALDAYGHQDVPFDTLVGIIHPERDPSRTSIFQVMFALQNVPPLSLQAIDLVVSPVELTSGTSKFDLTLFATEVADGLRLDLEYSSDLFDAATADRILAHFQILLEEIIANPDQAIGAIPMLTPEERRQVLRGWNAVGPGGDEADFDQADDDDPGSDLYECPRTELATNE